MFLSEPIMFIKNAWRVSGHMVCRPLCCCPGLTPEVGAGPPQLWYVNVTAAFTAKKARCSWKIEMQSNNICLTSTGHKHKRVPADKNGKSCAQIFACAEYEWDSSALLGIEGYVYSSPLSARVSLLVCF